jgi:hypothetical protein
VEAGVVTEESLQTVLRQIGQKRRQGVLVLTSPDGKLSLWFHQGKAVEASRSSTASPAEEVLTWLKGAHLIPEGFEWKPSPASSGNGEGEAAFDAAAYRELYLELAKTGVSLDAELYRRVLRQRVLEQIYRINLNESAAFTFYPKAVAIDREFSPSISVGQLLLDMVALPSNRIRFQELFPADGWVGRTDVPEGVLTIEERIVYDALTSPCALSELSARTMLSEFHLIDALLALYERGLVTAQQEPIRPSSLSVRDMMHHTVMRSVEAGMLVETIQRAASGPPRPSVRGINGEKTNATPLQRASRPEPPAAQESSLDALEQSPSKHRRVSLRLLESAAAVQFLAVVYVLLAFSLPWVTWGELFSFFAQ